MDEKKRILRVIDKTATDIDTKVEELVVPKVSNPNKTNPQTNPQTNPIYKKLVQFANAKIGDKWTIKDLLR